MNLKFEIWSESKLDSNEQMKKQEHYKNAHELEYVRQTL